MNCHFTTSIADILTCCQDGEFDYWGFPVNECKKFPCEKYKKLVKDIDEHEERTIVSKNP